MRNNFATAKEDQDGDVFVPKYNCYSSENLSSMSDTLVQLEKNYEDAFGEVPSADDMKNALKFVSSLFAEISETAPTTVYAQATHRLSWMIEEDSPVGTAGNIWQLRCLT